MKLGDLQKAGGVANGELIKKKGSFVTINAEGDVETVEFDFWVKQASYFDVTRIAKDDQGRDHKILMVAACVRLGDNGEEVLTYEQAGSLKPDLFATLLAGVTDAYAPKTSPQKMSSGASLSSTGLAGKRSKKPSATLRTKKR